MDPVVDVAALRGALSQIIGRACWSISGGDQFTRRVLMDFEGRRRRSQPIANPHLTEEQQLFEGECTVFTFCAWRLEVDGALVLTAESEDEGHPLADRLVGRTLASFDVGEPPGLDLTLRFSGGATFKTFTDRTDFDAYTIGVLDDSYSVCCGQVTLQRCDPP